MTSPPYSDLVTQAASSLDQARRELDRRLDDRTIVYALIADRHAVLSALEVAVGALG